MSLWSQRLLVIAAGLIFCSRSLLAFDGDVAIIETSFNEENFLDLKTYEFRKSLDHQWLQSDNGWRMTGGSVDIDRLYLDGELKINQDFSEKFTVRLRTEQLLFYSPKPEPHTMIEMDFHPWSQDYSFSFISNTAHDKRQVDMGGAVRIGQLPSRYLKYTWLDVDAFYNDKNDYDESYYSSKPHTHRLEGAMSYNPWRLIFHWEKDTTLKFLMPEESSKFFYQGQNYGLTVEYFIKKHNWLGVRLRGFEEKRQLEEITYHRKQSISYSSIDLYLNQSLYNEKYFFHAGARYDLFSNKLRNIDTPNQSFDYHFSTPQVYATIFHDYSSHAAWDIGVYLGNSLESKEFISNTENDRKYKSIQGKLRYGWEYHSLDKKNTLILHFSFNLDNLWKDPGDGAGMTYQSIF